MQKNHFIVVSGPHFLCWISGVVSHLTRDLSQAEMKITVVASWATDKMTTSTILSEVDVILCICSSHMLNGTTPKTNTEKKDLCGLEKNSRHAYKISGWCHRKGCFSLTIFGT